MRFRSQLLQKPLRVSRTWSNIACLALAPLCLAAAQAAPAQSVASGTADKLPVVTESGPLADGWQITAKADKHDCLPGELVKVSITLKNVFGEDQMPWGYSDSSFAASCSSVEMPATGHRIKGRQGWVDRRKLLQSSNTNVRYASPGWLVDSFHPGRAKNYKLAVNRFQDMTLDGAYKVIVKRDISDSTRLAAGSVYVQVGKAEK